MSLVRDLEAKLLDRGEAIAPPEALGVLQLPEAEVPGLIALAHRVRLEHCGPEVELESIISAKTGGCPEDCMFCSQSRHWHTPVLPEPFIDVDELVEAARRSQDQGVTEFCIVLAVRGPDERIMEQVLRAVEGVRRETDLNVACSVGLLTREQAETFAAAGVVRYNHNLEAARSFFPKVCSTHTWEDRRDTCLLVKDVGMQLCSGGIIGQGESVEQRVELAFELRELDPREVPVNFLNPRPGTPLAERPLVSPMDALRTIAMFRLVFPDAQLRYAGGREVTLRELQSLGMLAGINALIVGNYLTTLGRSTEEDLRMLADLDMPTGSRTKRRE